MEIIKTKYLKIYIRQISKNLKINKTFKSI